MSGPRVERILVEPTSLERHLDAVIEPRRQLPGDACADRCLRECAERTKLAPDVDVAAPEHVRLDGRLRQQLCRRRVRACQAIAVSALVELIRQAAHERCAEEIDLKQRGAQDDFRGVPAAPGVHPRQRAEQTRLAVDELLPSESNRYRGLGIAHICERSTEIEWSSEGRGCRPHLFARHAGILKVGLKREVLVGRDGDVEAESAERIGIVTSLDEVAVLEPFEPFAELAAHAQPRGHHLVGSIENRYSWWCRSWGSRLSDRRRCLRCLWCRRGVGWNWNLC